MDILFFLAGFLLGAIIVSVVFVVANNKTKSNSDALFNQMQLYFENTANKIFKESSQEFSTQNKEKLEDFFIRFRAKIEDFEKRTEEKFKTEQENFTKFDLNIRNFIEEGNKISQHTNTLEKIMKSDNRTQGHWGEIVLEKVLEASGLRRDEEYFVQKSAPEGRPDAIINLPENKCVMIDAKTSLASWAAYLEAESEDAKNNALKSFKDSTKAHIAGLSKRNYEPECGYTSPDYIMMFIPIESCYSLLFCDENELWNLAWKNNIMPVSPSTLLAGLKIINSFLVVDRQNKNSQEIARLASKMLDKFADMAKELIKAKSTLTSILKKLDGRDSIIVNINKMTELGAKMSKTLPEFDVEQMEEE